MEKRIYLASPHMGIEEEKFVKEAFDTNWIAPLGPNLNGFEREAEEYTGSKNALGLVSGTSAIHLALKASGMKKGDIIFCSSLTFAATCNPIVYEGGTPVFIDSEENSYNLSIKALEKGFKYYKSIGQTVKALIAVHLYGQVCDMDPIIKLCKEYKCILIEDAAEALGATYNGKQAGTFGQTGVFSFNGNKIITTSGGGMLISDDKELIEKARFWATQAKENERYYQHEELGYNYRMSNVSAGIGRGQLLVLNDRIQKKTEIFELYKKELSDIEEITMQKGLDNSKGNYWLTSMTINEDCKIKPFDVMDRLEKENIESRRFWKPMHLQPYYKDARFFNHNDVINEKEMSVSEDLFNRGVCLPSDTKMSVDEQLKVIQIIKELFVK